MASQEQETEEMEFVIWSAVVWSLWLVSDSVIFNGGSLDREQILDLIQWRSWIWLKSMSDNFIYFVFEWKSHPLICLQSL